MSTTELQQYASNSAQTASPGRLVVMLYDGFLKFASQARSAIEAGDVGAAGTRLTRAQDIVAELRVSLDMTQGPISENLAQLYEYVNDQLVQARLKRDVAPLDEAVTHMSSLREAWARIQDTPRPDVVRDAPATGVDLAG